MSSIAHADAHHEAHAQIGDGTPSPEARLATKLLAYLDEQDIEYAVVGDVRGYDRVVPSDIDIVVSESGLAIAPSLLTAFAAASSGRLVQAIRHERSATYFVLAHEVGDTVVYIHPDICATYVRRGRTLITAKELLQGRVRNRDGIFVPQTDRAFCYYLLKKIDKRSLDERAFQYLRGLWSYDREGCRKWAERFLGSGHIDTLVQSLDENRRDLILAALPVMRGALERRAPIRLADRWAELGRVVQRWHHPTGSFVAVYGPDGAGKSTVVDQVAGRLSPVFRRTRVYHLRPHLGRRTWAPGSPVTDPHGKPPRGWWTSVAKAAHWWLDATAGYVLRVRTQLARSTLVIFDRYIDDILVDPRRYRYGGPAWVIRLLRRLTPRPDLTVILDAPVEVLQSRKAEVTPAESERQRLAYRELAERDTPSIVVDAGATLYDVVRQVEGAVLDLMAERTARRLGEA